MTRRPSFDDGGQTEMISSKRRPRFELRKQQGRLVSGNAIPGQKSLQGRWYALNGKECAVAQKVPGTPGLRQVGGRIKFRGFGADSTLR